MQLRENVYLGHHISTRLKSQGEKVHIRNNYCTPSKVDNTRQRENYVLTYHLALLLNVLQCEAQAPVCLLAVLFSLS